MTPRPDLSDYIEVSERIIEFRQKFPDGSLSSEVVLWPTKDLPFLAVKAFAHRSRKDENPGVGHAWEPFPGKTPYTRDSELQNAETSAVGRAIVFALAADVRRGIASADEVRARRDSEPTATRTSHLGGGSGNAGTGATQESPPASVPAPSSAGEVGTAPVEASGMEVEVAGEGTEASAPATPEQRTRLLAVYKKPSEAKAKAVQLFDRFEKVGDVLIADLTSSEVESLILAAAG